MKKKAKKNDYFPVCLSDLVSLIVQKSFKLNLTPKIDYTSYRKDNFIKVDIEYGIRDNPTSFSTTKFGIRLYFDKINNDFVIALDPNYYFNPYDVKTKIEVAEKEAGNFINNQFIDRAYFDFNVQPLPDLEKISDSILSALNRMIQFYKKHS